MNRYIEADKLLDIIIKMRKEYATQEVAEDHKGLRAVLGGQCLVLTKIIEIINSLQQEQPEVDLEKFISDFFDKKDAENNGRWSEDDIVEAMTLSFELGKTARKEK